MQSRGLAHTHSAGLLLYTVGGQKKSALSQFPQKKIKNSPPSSLGFSFFGLPIGPLGPESLAPATGKPEIARRGGVQYSFKVLSSPFRREGGLLFMAYLHPVKFRCSFVVPTGKESFGFQREVCFPGIYFIPWLDETAEQRRVKG